MTKYYFQAWEGEKEKLIELTNSDTEKGIKKFGAQELLDGLMKKNRNPNITKAYLLKDNKDKKEPWITLAKWNSLCQLNIVDEVKIRDYGQEKELNIKVRK